MYSCGFSARRTGSAFSLFYLQHIFNLTHPAVPHIRKCPTLPPAAPLISNKPFHLSAMHVPVEQESLLSSPDRCSAEMKHCSVSHEVTRKMVTVNCKHRIDIINYFICIVWWRNGLPWRMSGRDLIQSGFCFKFAGLTDLKQGVSNMNLTSALFLAFRIDDGSGASGFYVTVCFKSLPIIYSQQVWLCVKTKMDCAARGLM